jgi:hypothetical protein
VPVNEYPMAIETFSKASNYGAVYIRLSYHDLVLVK